MAVATATAPAPGKTVAKEPIAPEVASNSGPLPRVIKEMDRAPETTQRYKIRCLNYGPCRWRYILAKKGDAESAKTCYVKAEGIDKKIAAVEKLGNKPEPANLVVVPLPD